MDANSSTSAQGSSSEAEPVQHLTTVPPYWDDAKAELMSRDRIMARLIPQFGDMQLEGRYDPFTTLARSIIGQQISVVAAQRDWQRFKLAYPRTLPANIIRGGLKGLAEAGLSKRKSEYIFDLASHFSEKRVHVSKWARMGDEDVIAELVAIRGITRWTAEMFLIFNLLRPNVIPLDDPGLMKSISVNYFSGEPVSRIDAREVSANWEPWRTVATWYMWRSLDALQAAPAS